MRHTLFKKLAATLFLFTFIPFNFILGCSPSVQIYPSEAVLVVGPATKPTSFPSTLPTSKPIRAVINPNIERSPHLEKLQELIVTITVTDEIGRMSLGTGFVVGEDKDHYLILTARHVLCGVLSDLSKSILVHQISHNKYGVISEDTNNLVAKCVKDSPELDLALISINKTLVTFPKGPYFRFTEGQLPAVGAKIFALGCPKGDPAILSTGMVSSYFLNGDITYIQTTSLGVKGVSGGPLMNDKMEVIGVVQMAISDGLNMSITVADIKEWLKEAGFPKLGF